MPNGEPYTYVRAYNNDSVSIWNYSVPGDGVLYNDLDTMTTGDLGDGLNIIFSDDDYETIHVLNSTGSLLWRYAIGKGPISYRSTGSSPATDIGDVNMDGINDIGVASEDGYAHILQSVRCIARFNDSTAYNMTWNQTDRS